MTFNYLGQFDQGSSDNEIFSPARRGDGGNLPTAARKAGPL